MYMKKLFFCGVNCISIPFVHSHDCDFLLVEPLINYSPQQLIFPTLPPTVSLYLCSCQNFYASWAVPWML